MCELPTHDVEYSSHLTTVLISAFLFLNAQFLALILVVPFKSMGVSAFENPENPVNSILYLALFLVVTAIILLIVRLFGERAIRYVFMGAIIYTFFYIVYLLLITVLSDTIAFISSVLITVFFMYFTFRRPTWYLMDGVAIIVGGGIIAVLGVSLAIIPSIIFMVGLAIYDFIAVYKTKHMISLAEAAIKVQVPLLLIVPKGRGKIRGRYSNLDDARREAFFMGLGDVIIPGVLVTSSYIYLPLKFVYYLPANLIVAMATLAGALCGMVFVLLLAVKGKPQAGLPFINTGAILAFAIAYSLIYL